MDAALALTCLGEIAKGFLGKVGECLFPPILREYKSMFCFNSNITELETQLKKLETTKRGVQQGVEEELRNVSTVAPDVKSWLERANKVTIEVEGIIQEAKKAVKKTEQESREESREENREEESREENREEESREENREESREENRGWPQLRYSLSKKAVKITEVVVELQAAGAQYTKLSCSPEPSCMGIIPNGDFTEFESRRLVMEEIIKALKNDEINLIGVCGMGGVGKTTLVNEVAKTVKKGNHFDEVAMAKVGQKPDLTYVQACIADTLGLKNLRNTVSPIERANLLRKRLLQNSKKVLVILDDIWAERIDLQGERIDLQGMGIPLEGADKNVKLLYTSRTQDLWHDLPTKQEIPLKILSEDEAWQLFRAKAGDSADAPDLQPIAKQIMNECGRLPLALVLIGSALSKKSGRDATKKIWEAILYRLTHATSAPADKGLYSSLELSYEYLEDEQDKRLFLLCCLFEEDKDIRIEDLARYGLGLSLFDGILEMESVRSQVFLIVDDLKSRHLLLDGENKEEECVKVHDVVRDMGISIASKNKFALVIHGEVSEWPKMDTYEHYTCISLISRKITELPRELKCPNLEFLLLDCRFLRELPCQFFEGMEKLKVLVVNDFNGILSLPSSLRNLHTLSLLFLDGKLDNVFGLGGLSSLKTLRFRYSQMEELPEEIGELVDLRLLDLTDNEQLKRIPPNVISRLVDLEELYVGLVDFNLKELYLGGAFMAFEDWEGEGKEGEGRNANLRELELLSNLNTLEIGIRSDVLIPKVPIFSKLKIYKVIIFQEDYNYMEILSYWFAEELQDEMYNLFCKCERVFMVRSSIPIPSNRGGIDSLLRISDYLFLEGKGCNDLVQALLRPDGVDGLQKLKFLRIGRCDTPEYLANTRNLVHPPIAHVPAIFPILEVLHLLGPVNLRKICRGPVPAGSFGELTFIHVHNCGRLRNLFHLPIGGCLPQLKRLIINSCDMMEEVFRKEQQEANKIEFPKLEVLKLEELPSLVRFCRGIDQIDFPQLKELCLGDIPRVNLMFHNSFLSLFPEKVSLPNLEVLRVDKLENLERLGQRPLSVGSFSKLNKIFMRDCGKLLCVIPSQFVSMLRELQELTVESCNSLEVVFELEGLNSNEPNPTTRTKSIPQLHKLKVSSCEMLSRIVAEENGLGESSVDEVEFPLLERLELLNLPNLVSFFPNVNGNTTTLAKSTDHYYNPLQPHQPLFNKKVAFPSLEYLELSGLESVSDLWCSELPTCSFSKLKTLNVRGFPNLRSTFHLSMVGGLVNLSELVITDCSKMEGVVYWEEEIEDGQGRKVEKTLFPLLRKLQLSNLPNLVSFFPNVNTTLAKSTDHYHNPMQPQPLFNEKVAFPCLKYLGLSGLRNVSDIPTSSFSKRKNLQVTDSTSLRNFPCILWIDDLNNTTQGLQEVAGLLYHKDLMCNRVLALGSNGTMTMWKWEYDSEHNPSGEATARVLPDSGLAMTNDVTGVNLEEAVPCMALSEFSNCIISACGGKVSLYHECKVERTFMPPPPASTFLAFHPQDIKFIAIGMEDSTIRIYHRWEDKVKSELKGHEKRITGLAFSTILNTLVSSAADAQLCFWRIDTWEHLKSIPIQLPTGKACNGDTRVQFHSDQIRLLVSHETQLAIYDAFEMDRIRQWVLQDVLPAPISFAVYSCDSQLVYTSFCDGNIGVFDADSLTLGRIVPSMCLYPTMLSGGQAVYPRVIAAHPKKPNQFAIGLTNGSILLMEPQESEGKWELSPSIDNGMLNDRTTSSSNTSNHTLDKNGDGPMARSMEKPKTLDDVTDKSKPWKVAETRCQLVVMPDSTDEAHKVARLLYRNGCEVLALGCNGALRLWRRYLKVSASGLAMINDVTGVNLEEAVPCMALSKNYGNIISACGGKVSLFNIEKFKVIKKFMSPPPSSTFLAFHPQDDKIIAIGMEDSTIRIKNVWERKVRSELKGHEKRITGLAFSTELKRLVSSGADAQLCIWSIDTWEHLKSVPIQLPDGKACNGDTRVQFHSDQIHLLVSHETQLAIYDASKMDRIRQWVPAVPQDVLPAPISFAAYSCDGQIVYTSFCNGNIGVFDADSLTLTCHILPSVYFPTLSSGSQAVYPAVVATHPFKPNQFAIGLTNGSVILIEPPESEGKWGLSPTVYHEGMLNDRIAFSSNTSNHKPDQKRANQWYDVDSDEEDEWANQWYDVDSDEYVDEEDEDTDVDVDVEEDEDMDEDDQVERRVLKSRKRTTRTITSTVDNVTLNDRTASSSNTSNHTPDQFHSVEEGDSATSSAHIFPQASDSESGLTLPALQDFQFGTYPQQPKPECYRRQPQRPKPKHYRRHPPRPLLQEGEINSVVQLDESEGGVVP